jgi:two-component system cell cycle sensor histidine kinase/response regulator CckA
LSTEGSVTGMVGLLMDITEQKMLQDQLQQAQKMEAVGTLAGGVAHDFNNLLQAILGYTDLLLLRMSESEKLCRELEQIKRSADRGAELTQQLLTFSRRVESKLRPTDLNHEVKQVYKLLQRTIPKMVNIELRLDEHLRTINSDPAQMEQIMMNLAVNAKDAMLEGGTLLIETKNVTLDEDFCRKHVGAKPGDFVCLRISDTGHGIGKDKLDKIFEPFFTTKESGKGTGLGLAMVYGIVKNHCGYILCDSEVGLGTSFEIYLPMIEQPCETSEDREQATPPLGGSETILLVDDEITIRDLGSQILSHFGYKVLTAPDGESALVLYRTGNEPVDLFILDLIMPGMGGKQCLEEILKIEPTARVLISSGHALDDSIKQVIESGTVGFIKKPWNSRQMLQAIDAALH